MRKANRVKRDKRIVTLLRQRQTPAAVAVAMDVSERWVRKVAAAAGLTSVRVYTTAKAGK